MDQTQVPPIYSMAAAALEDLKNIYGINITSEVVRRYIQVGLLRALPTSNEITDILNVCLAYPFNYFYCSIGTSLFLSRNFNNFTQANRITFTTEQQTKINTIFTNIQNQERPTVPPTNNNIPGIPQLSPLFPTIYQSPPPDTTFVTGSSGMRLFGNFSFLPPQDAIFVLNVINLLTNLHYIEVIDFAKFISMLNTIPGAITSPLTANILSTIDAYVKGNNFSIPVITVSPEANNINEATVNWHSSGTGGAIVTVIPQDPSKPNMLIPSISVVPPIYYKDGSINYVAFPALSAGSFANFNITVMVQNADGISSATSQVKVYGPRVTGGAKKKTIKKKRKKMSKTIKK
jgi:hypothetical protein